MVDRSTHFGMPDGVFQNEASVGVFWVLGIKFIFQVGSADTPTNFLSNIQRVTNIDQSTVEHGLERTILLVIVHSTSGIGGVVVTAVDDKVHILQRSGCNQINQSLRLNITLMRTLCVCKLFFSFGNRITVLGFGVRTKVAVGHSKGLAGSILLQDNPSGSLTQAMIVSLSDATLLERKLICVPEDRANRLLIAGVVGSCFIVCILAGVHIVTAVQQELNDRLHIRRHFLQSNNVRIVSRVNRFKEVVSRVQNHIIVRFHFFSGIRSTQAIVNIIILVSQARIVDNA